MSDPLRNHINRIAHHLQLGDDRADSPARVDMCEDIAHMVIGLLRTDQEAADRKYIADRLLVVAAAMRVGGVAAVHTH